MWCSHQNTGGECSSERKRREIGSILRTLCNWEGIKIIEAEVCPDHIHMLIEIPPKIAVASFMGYLKGKSSLMLYEKFPELKYKYRNREFWCRGYYVDTAGKKCKEDTGVHLTTIRAGQSRRATNHAELLKCPFTGGK